MANITFYPIGNADSSLTEFADERLMLIDYCNCKNAEDDDDKRIDLAEELRLVLRRKDRKDFDVVAFTHRDSDHVHGAEDFFWLKHAKKYQDDDRVKIKEMWVPACFILEEGLSESARVMRQEARHRLIEGEDIRVFGNPCILDDWFRSKNINPEERERLITHAGDCVPDFSEEKGQAEIFVHAPFSFQMDNIEVDQNQASLVLHVTFFEEGSLSRVFFGADTTCDIWDMIVYKTKKANRPERLIWDAFKISHHCSYKALSDEKGKDKTKPIERVSELFDEGQDHSYLISSSEPIPSKNTTQPPHRQAAAYYRDVANENEGDFLVTMETPSESKPEPIVIEITKQGLSWKKITGIAVGIPAIVSAPSPRQG